MLYFPFLDLKRAPEKGRISSELEEKERMRDREIFREEEMTESIK